jgi:hypothetical protein
MQPATTADHIINEFKKTYVLNVKGFDPEKMVACTMQYEGTK